MLGESLPGTVFPPSLHGCVTFWNQRFTPTFLESRDRVQLTCRLPPSGKPGLLWIRMPCKKIRTYLATGTLDNFLSLLWRSQGGVEKVPEAAGNRDNPPPQSGPADPRAPGRSRPAEGSPGQKVRRTLLGTGD
jgi:hypothetical protein